MSARVAPRRLLAPLCAALALALIATACTGAAQNARGKVDKNDAVIKITCNVADAELWINDRFVAHVGSLSRGIALGPGEHRLELRHDRYHTHYEILAVSARERRQVAIELAEILP